MAPILTRVCRVIRNNLLSILTIAGVILGLIGGAVNKSKYPDLEEDDNLVKGLRIPGDLLLRGLNIVVLPLVVTSLIIGLSGNKRTAFNRQAGITALYYLSTTLIAVTLGLILVSVILPGVSKSGRVPDELDQDTVKENSNATVLDVIVDMIKNIVPDNMVSMAFQKTRTIYPGTGPEAEVYQGINMLGVITVSIIFGVIAMANREECQPFLNFCLSLNLIINKLTKLVLWYSPIGIMFIILAEYSVSDISGYASQIGMYIVTVLVGLAIHFLIILPAILWSTTQRNPFTFYRSLLPAMATAFGTASSTVTIPLTMKCTKKAGVSNDIVDFVIPVGATINMDGTALYEAVACLFIAQLNEVQLSNPQIVITGLTATVAAIGAAGIPSAGLVTLVMVLNAVDLDTRHIALILTIDWFLDRFRTMTNIVGDAVGCAVIERLAGSSIDDGVDNGGFTELKTVEEAEEKDMDNAVGA